MKKIINKILDQLGYIIIYYGLAMLFVILITLIFENDIVIIDDLSKLGIYFFVIKPIPYAIAIYLYKGIRELKRQWKQYISVYEKELSMLKDDIVAKKIQITSLEIMDKSRLSVIDIRDKEIIELKNKLIKVSKGELILAKNNTGNSITKGSIVYKELSKDVIKKKRKTINIKEDEPTELKKENPFEKVKRTGKRLVIPFVEDVDTTEQQYICPECGKEMTRQTAKIIFCDNIECTRKQWKKEAL